MRFLWNIQLIIYLLLGPIFMYYAIRPTSLDKYYILDGEFIGYDNELDETYYMTITKITKAEYKSANGENVLYDTYKKTYFSVDLYYTKDETKFIVPLKDFEGYGKPVCYRDVNDTYITPMINEPMESWYGEDPLTQEIYQILVLYNHIEDNYAGAYMYFAEYFDKDKVTV